MVEPFPCFIHDSGNDSLFPLCRTPVKSHCFIDCPAQSIGIVVAENDTIARSSVLIEHINCIMQTAGIMYNRYGTVILTGHLRQSAGFKARRHQHKVGGGKAQTRQMFVKITHRHPVIKVVECDYIFEYLLILPVGNDGDLKIALPVTVNYLIERIGKECAAFLHRIKPVGPEKQRRILIDMHTGKMKELDLIGFRDAKINMYDIDYCQGMRQVAEISAKAQVDQIGFDENIMNEIGNIRRELVDDLQKQRDKAVERARLLLVENKDLKEFLKEKGLIDEVGQVIDND